MSFTHQVHFTKNILCGPLQGLQIQSVIPARTAFEAAKASSDLCVGGIHTDAITNAPWTAHNVNIRSSESELDDLIEPVDFRPLDADELANLADAMEVQ